VLFVRQYRAAIGEALLELPAGKLDVVGEPAEACARRELIEEIGRDARLFTDLGWFYNSPGFTDERTSCFLAEGLIADRRSAQGVEERHMTIERVSIDDIDDLIAAGELVDAKSLIGLFLARSWLTSHAQP
jgi:ADP-ribose pyrophosphatase